MNFQIPVQAMPKSFVFILSVIIFSVSATFSQNYYFDNYGVADGLDQSKVYDIIQDDEHFIWLGTQSGASVFDGRSFENKHEKDGLAPNAVRTFFKDSRGWIWMGHDKGGISIYADKKIKALKLPDVEIKGDITSFAEDDSGKIWITTFMSGALSLSFAEDLSKISVVQYKGKSLSDLVFGSLKLKDGTLLFITDVGIKKFISDSNYFEPFYIEGLDLYFQFTALYEDNSGNLWFGTYNGGLYKYNKKEQKFTYFDEKNGLVDKWITALIEDRRGNIWVGTWEGGISCFRENDVIGFNTNNGLQDKKINCIYEDVEGNILIGTYEHGLSIFKGFHFVNFTSKDGLAGNQIKAIFQDKKGNIWFGTNNGLSCFNPETNEYKTFNQQTHNISSDIRFIKDDPDGNLWIGTNDGGVYNYNFTTNKFEYDIILNHKLMAQYIQVKALVVDKHNQLWVGTNDGLVYFEINTRKGDRLTQRNGIAGNEITALFLDSEDILWIGSRDKGVTRFYNKISEFRILKNLGDFTPVSFTEDAQKRIWIATEGEGIIILSGDSVSRTVTMEDGLLSNLITLLDADENNIYIGTHRGLNVYNLKENKIYTYTNKSGFTGIETKSNASFVDKNGNIWFGTVAGAIKYSPSLEEKTTQEPLTHIQEILVNDEVRTLKPGVELKHYENKITFRYYSICLSDPSSIHYQYMLKGFEDEWQAATDDTEETYKNLDPGEYSFLVRASNNYGIWNEIPASFDYFIIKPPFYKTKWFIISCIILGLIIIFSYIKIRERNLIKEKRILEETVRERTFELQEKKDQLEVINKDITDSIQYAQRIQFAMFPQGLPFKDMFVFFRPKDIVSGDFYWFQTKENLEFMAAVDCTGHGVPGAFVSIIGYNTLTKIVKEYGIVKPSDILNRLNKEIIVSLHQKNNQNEYENVKDGMDLSLICYDKKNNNMQFAGAYNPLLLIRNSELIETKADRVAIGHDNATAYTNHSFNIEPGDAIYMFSDGYADQFGGLNRKKYKTAQFKRLLLEIQDKTMKEQMEILERTHDEWKGQNEQIDDIIVIGRKF